MDASSPEKDLQEIRGKFGVGEDGSVANKSLFTAFERCLTV